MRMSALEKDCKDILILISSCAQYNRARYFVDKSIFFAELLGFPKHNRSTLVAVGTSSLTCVTAMQQSRVPEV